MDFAFQILLTLAGVAVCILVGISVGRQATYAAIRSLRQDNKKLEKTLVQYRKMYDEDSERLKAKDDLLEDYVKSIDKFSAEVDLQDARILALEADKKHLELQVAELNTVIQEKSARCAKLEDDLNKEVAERRWQENRACSMSNIIMQQNAAIEELQDKLAERDAVIKGLQAAQEESCDSQQLIDVASVEDRILSRLQQFTDALHEEKEITLGYVEVVYEKEAEDA